MQRTAHAWTALVLLLALAGCAFSSEELVVLSPQILTRNYLPLTGNRADFGTPFIQGRPCQGRLKPMGLEESCTLGTRETLPRMWRGLRRIGNWSAVPNEADYRGTVALVMRGQCTFHEKALVAEMAGAVGLIVINNTPGNLQHSMVADMKLPTPHIPIFIVSEEVGAILQKFVLKGSTDVVVSLCFNVNREHYV